MHQKKHFNRKIVNIFIRKRLVMVLIIGGLTAGLLSFMPGPKAEPYIDMQTLIDHSKLKHAEAVLAPFMDGESTTRVIVDLLPGRKGPRLGFNNMAVREQLVQDVNNYQEMVIGRMDPNYVRITNRFTYVFGFSAEVTQQGLQALLNDKGVLAVIDDAVLKAHTDQGITLMNADTVRSSYNGQGLSIAICDTGIDYTHPRLGNGGFPNSKVIGGYDCGQNDSNPMDANGHGTCCAGIAAGNLGTVGDYVGGVAYNAKLYAVKISSTTTGGSASTSDMIEAWEWCITHQNDNSSYPIMIISTSFGGGQYSSSCNSVSTSMTDAAYNAKAAGMTLFVSSGNDGFCDALGWPACITHVVSVGAVFDSAYGHYGWCLHVDTCAPQSSLFTCPGSGYPYVHEADQVTAADLVTVYSNTASFLTLLAPSSPAYTTDITGSGGYDSGDYYDNFGGTSAACPYAAGAAACLQSAAYATNGSFLPPDTVEYFLTSTGDDITDTKVAITKPRINLGAAYGGITPVSVTDFKVSTDSGQAVAEWQTSSESGTVGFYLLRKGPKDRVYKPVNQRILMGLLTAPQGGTYRVVDAGAVAGEVYQYKVVEVVAKGGKRTYGPYSVAVGQTGISQPAARTFRYVKKVKPAAAGSFFRAAFGRRAHPLSSRKKVRLKAGKLAKKWLKHPPMKWARDRAKITIRKDGLYLIRTADIANTLGLNPFQAQMMIRSKRLRLTNRGNEIAWLPAPGNRGVYFYGQKLESLYTDENVYWLVRGRGTHMAYVNGGHPVPVSGLSFADVDHVEKEQYALTALFDNANEDYWLWDVIVAGESGKKFPFVITNVSHGDESRLTVLLKGATDTPHVVKVKLNGSQIGTSSWQGTGYHPVSLDFDSSLLHAGENTVEVTGGVPEGTPYSIFYLDSFDIKYHRFYQAFNNRLFCRGDGNSVITAGGFSNRNIMVFDVTQPSHPLLVTGTTIDLQNRVSFVPASPDRRYLVVGGLGVSLPAAVAGSAPFKLKGNRQTADYIIIIPEGFSQAARDLVYLRRHSGFSPLVVELGDIYDQFNHGIAEPIAIRNFLSHVYRNWGGGDQKFVVLAGEGTYDYKDHLGYGENLIPPLMTGTPDGIFAADNLYGDVSGDDGIPEFVVGRIPVATAQELQAYVQKLTTYENSSGEWTGRVIMVADNQDGGGNFPYDSDRLADMVSGYDVKKVYLPHFSGIDEAREALFGEINKGAAMINYVGHAGLNKFAQEGWLEIDDLSYLQNGNTLPVMTAMTCVSGRFSLPGFDTLGELMVLKADGGVVAALAPTGFSQNFEANGLAQQLFRAIFSNHTRVFGKAVLEAMGYFRQNGGPAHLTSVYNILGDPAVNIK